MPFNVIIDVHSFTTLLYLSKLTTKSLRGCRQAIEKETQIPHGLNSSLYKYHIQRTRELFKPYFTHFITLLKLEEASANKLMKILF